MDFEIVDADLSNSEHSSGLVEILDEYARLPHIAGRGLSDEVKSQLVGRLSEQPSAVILLAVDSSRVIGVAILFRGFSTFAGKPVLNLHDLAVRGDTRGRGVGRGLLETARDRARELGCCSLTLEVSGDNGGAKRLYESVGFNPVHEFWKLELT